MSELTFDLDNRPKFYLSLFIKRLEKTNNKELLNIISKAKKDNTKKK